MFKVLVRGAKGDVFDFEVAGEVVTFGRAPENDILLSSDQASKYHAKIFIQNGDIMVQDLDSSNGTYIRKEKVRLPTQVEEEDPIQMGDIFVRVSYTPDKKGDSKDDDGYSLAQRLGNRKATTHIDATELRKE